jgi:predicted secreted protein
MTNALAGYGVLLKIGDGGGSETFTTIAEVKDIEGPELELEAKEVTSHDSPAGWREYIGTLLSGGEVSFDVNFIPTNATHSYSAGLIKDLVNRTKRNFKLVFPDGGSTTWTFAALVVGVKPSGPVEDELSAEVTLQVTGQPTLA